jgi:hypothetical protein
MKNFKTKDPYLLLSLLNTTLRDESSDLEDLCLTFGIDKAEIEKQMAGIGYVYNRQINQFK